MNNYTLIPEEFFLNVDVYGILMCDSRVLYVLRNRWSNENTQDNVLTFILAHLHPEIFYDIPHMTYDEMFENVMRSREISSQFKKVFESLLEFNHIDLNEIALVENVEEKTYLNLALKLTCPQLFFDYDLQHYVGELLRIENEHYILYQLGYEKYHQHER